MNVIKIFLSATLLIMAFTMSGCQGNNSDTPETNTSAPDTNTTPPDTNTTLPPVDINATTDIKNLSIINGNVLTITGSGAVKDIYIMAFNSSGSTNTEGKVTFQYPAEFINNGTFYGLINPGTATISDGRVHFVYTAPDDLSEINGTRAQFFFYDTTNADANVSLFIDFNLTGDYTSTDPLLKTLILSDSNLTINSSNQVENLSLQAYTDQSTTNINTTLDIKYPSEIIEKKVNIGILPSTLNIVDGIVNFTYTGVPNIEETIAILAANGISNPIIINIYDSSTGSNVNLDLNFEIPVKDVSNYVLSVVPTDANITTASESKVIDVYLENNVTSRPLANETILLDFFNGDEGTMSSFTGVTDANGHVAFNYTAPSTLPADTANFTTLTFTLDGNRTNSATQTAEANVTLGVNTTVVVDPKYDNYVLKAYPENNVTIRSGSESVVLEIYLEDNSTNLPVVGENVVIEFFGSTQGSLDKFSAKTDDNGQIAFNYTSPVDLTDINNTKLNVVFKLSGSTDVNDSLAIDFNTTLKDYSDYSLALVDVNRTITSSSQVEVFNLYLEDNSTGTPQSAEGDRIIIDYFDGTLGTVNSFNGVTDANGHVQFTYTAPVDLVDLNGSAITFRVQNTTASQNEVKSIFTVSSNASLLSKLQLTTSSITLSQNGEVRTIDVLAFNGNGEAFSDGSVTVRYPDEISNGSRVGGQFAQGTVNIVEGKASFSFTGPDPLSNKNALNFTFIYTQDSDINTTLTINYTPDIPQIVIDDGNITVTKNGEIVNVTLSIYDKDYAPYPNGNIKIKYPASVLNGKNVGSFDVSTTSVVNGKATFIYTAANPLDGNDSNVFTFYHDSQPALSEVDFNISIVPDASQVVLTNYVLNATYETNMNLETTKGMTFYIEDDKNVKIDDSNVTSIKVTVLNSALGSLEDTGGHTGSSLTVTNKNSVQMNIKSNTLSGVIPIEVYSEFKDANNEDKNLTRVFNVVVKSGAPTAMSLSYAGTSQDSEHAKFIENWVLTVTDKYNNLVNSTPSISMGAIIGYADSSANTANIANYLYFDSATNDGNLTDANPDLDTFTSKYNAFDSVNDVNDKLVLFGGNGYKFNAYGKWDIKEKNSTTLELIDDYNGSRVEELGYAVGHNFRNEVCDGSSVVANVYAKDGNNTLGSNGSMIIQVEYDYYLVGKSIVLWANLVGEHNDTAVRTGIGKKVTLRGNGLTGESYHYAKGFEGNVRLNIKITDTVEYYKNANFGYLVEVTGDDTNWTVEGTSISDGNITDCSLNSGVAYIDVNITSEAVNAGDIIIRNLIPSSEF